MAKISLLDGTTGGTRVGFALRALGAVSLVVTGVIHIDLYLTGYRHIPTIGTLFVLQAIAAIILGVAALLSSRRFVSIAGFAFALGTIAGYIFSLWVGLFGFHEVRTGAGVTAGVFEIITFACLGLFAFVFTATSSVKRGDLNRWTRHGVTPAVVLVALVFIISVGNASGMASTKKVGSAPSKNMGNTSLQTSEPVKVTIKNFLFSPARLTVSPGAEIIVTNRDTVDHTLTAVPGTSTHGTFDTGNIAYGKSVTITAPSTPGQYPFYCSIHNFMTGTLIVK